MKVGFDEERAEAEYLWRFMAALIGAQDNQATAYPIFMVQQRVRDYGYDPAWSDNIAWLDSPNDCREATSEEAAALEARYRDTGHEPAEWTRTAYHDRWENVQPFFTQVGAEQYIEVNRHNLTAPRVYVASGHRNHEWQAVRTMLTLDHPRP